MREWRFDKGFSVFVFEESESIEFERKKTTVKGGDGESFFIGANFCFVKLVVVWAFFFEVFFCGPCNVLFCFN